MKLIDELRLKTYNEAVELLDTYGKACIIRPTGFGKTGILTRLIKDHIKKAKGTETKVLFLYPSDPVLDAVLEFFYNKRSLEYRKMPNVKCVTYMGLLRMPTEVMRSYSKVSLIVTDECHLTGAKETSVALRRLLKALPDAKLVGATATPLRMDEFDEVGYFFDNRVTSSYSLSDAFDDGVIQKPYYCYCSYALKEDIKELKKTVSKRIKDFSSDEKNQIMKRLESKFIEMANIYKMDSILKTTLNTYAKDTDYMKGIFFFKNINHLKESKAQVVGWFKKAFPDYKIRTLVVTTDTSETSNNRFKLDSMKRESKCIDIICAVNILNMGYHTGELTFIGMYRGTKSATLFSQQLGRALSSGSLNSCIVFDLVDNLHSKALTQALDRKEEGSVNDKARYLELKEKMIKSKGKEDLTVLSEDEKEEYKILKAIFTKKVIRNKIDFYDTNKIFREDLVATSHQATLDEMFSKIIEEPLNIACRLAYEMWKQYGGDDSGGTVDYVLNTSLEEGKVPLVPFCVLKGVSLERVLTVIFGEGNYTVKVKAHLKKAREKGISTSWKGAV